MVLRAFQLFLTAAVPGLLLSCSETPAGASQTPRIEASMAPVTHEAEAENHTLTVDGLERSYYLYRPAGLKPNAPLVFVIHGFTDNARNMMQSTKMNGVADARGFAVCYPQGTKDDQGRTFWEVGYSFSEKYQRNDVRFLVTLARQLQADYQLSSENTFASGMSNGAEMSIVLGLLAPETFRAVAAICGCVMNKTRDRMTTVPTVPALFLNGDADDTTFWHGDMEDKAGWGPYLPVSGMLDLFTAGDPGLVRQTADLPDINKTDGSRVQATTWSNAATGRQVVFYKVIGGGHDWPGARGNQDLDASAEIGRFFAQYFR
jgi:polyhydroxybutyrate depolymerase